MTTAVSAQKPGRLARLPRKITRRTAILLAVLVALPLIGLGYLAEFGQCDRQSKFCAISVVGTRSEVVVGWDAGISVFAQTYPSNPVE